MSGTNSVTSVRRIQRQAQQLPPQSIVRNGHLRARTAEYYPEYFNRVDPTSIMTGSPANPLSLNGWNGSIVAGPDVDAGVVINESGIRIAGGSTTSAHLSFENASWVSKFRQVYVPGDDSITMYLADGVDLKIRMSNGSVLPVNQEALGSHASLITSGVDKAWSHIVADQWIGQSLIFEADETASNVADVGAVTSIYRDDTGVGGSAGNLIYNVPTSSIHVFQINNVPLLTIPTNTPEKGALLYAENTTGTGVWQRDQFNVIVYGADSGGGSDASSEIQAAIDDAEAANGGVVYFPEGTYKISTKLELNKADPGNKRIILSGFGATIKPDTNTIALEIDGTVGNTAVGYEINGIHFQGQSTTGTTGVLIRDQDRVSLRNVRFEDLAVGLHLQVDEDDSGDHWVEGTSLVDAFFSNCTKGVHFDNADSAPSAYVSFFETYFENVGIQGSATGIDIERYANLTRSVFKNISIWPAASGTGWSIDGDMKNVQADIHVERQASSVIGVSIGSNATNMTRWHPHFDFVDTSGSWAAKILDPSQLMFPAITSLGPLTGWLYAHGAGPPIGTITATDSTVAHAAFTLTGMPGVEFSNNVGKGYIARTFRVPDDWADDGDDFAIQVIWYVDGTASTDDVFSLNVTVRGVAIGEDAGSGGASENEGAHISTHVSGTHTGSNGASVLTDSTASFIGDRVSSGDTVTNTTDGSSGTISSSSNITATTITASLSGGTDNDWDNGDAFIILTSPDEELQSTYHYFTDGVLSRGDLANIVLERDGGAANNDIDVIIVDVILCYRRNT